MGPRYAPQNTRTRPLSDIDIAILTLSDPESTSRRWVREVKGVPEQNAFFNHGRFHANGQDQYVAQPEDAPMPLFAPQKVIDRDMVRMEGLSVHRRVASHTRLFQQSSADGSGVPDCWCFNNTCERIDAEPRSTNHPLGVFTEAEMDMFDPVFRDFIKDCYKYGIPGYGEPFKQGPGAGIAPTNPDGYDDHKPSRRKHKGGPPQLLLDRHAPAAYFSTVGKLSDPYWDIEGWKKWATGVTAGARTTYPKDTQVPVLSPTCSAVPEHDPFTDSPKTRPSRADSALGGQDRHYTQIEAGNGAVVGSGWVVVHSVPQRC